MSSSASSSSLNRVRAESSDLQKLHAFVVQHVPSQASTSGLAALSGDAGFRSYYRLDCQPPLLAVLAPPETENSAQFCRVAEWLLAHGVHAPKVIAKDLNQGFMLVEDFGDRLLQGELSNDSVCGYYGEALSLLLHQQAAPAEAFFPEYNEVLLGDELSLFVDWFVSQLLSLSLSNEESAIIELAFAKLIKRAKAQQQVVVHRDFHSRNLLVLDDGSLAAIDFQDAVVGPVTYDVVSLLKDCYVSWPQDQVERWALSYAAMAHDAGILDDRSEADFLIDFHWMGLQRHIKVLGIFARLYLRDGKTRYLSDLPLVLRYTREVLSHYDAFNDFSTLMSTRIVPAFQTKEAELVGLAGANK